MLWYGYYDYDYDDDGDDDDADDGWGSDPFRLPAYKNIYFFYVLIDFIAYLFSWWCWLFICLFIIMY